MPIGMGGPPATAGGRAPRGSGDGASAAVARAPRGSGRQLASPPAAAAALTPAAVSAAAARAVAAARGRLSTAAPPSGLAEQDSGPRSSPGTGGRDSNFEDGGSELVREDDDDRSLANSTEVAAAAQSSAQRYSRTAADGGAVASKAHVHASPGAEAAALSSLCDIATLVAPVEGGIAGVDDARGTPLPTAAAAGGGIAAAAAVASTVAHSVQPQQQQVLWSDAMRRSEDVDDADEHVDADEIDDDAGGADASASAAVGHAPQARRPSRIANPNSALATAAAAAPAPPPPPAAPGVIGALKKGGRWSGIRRWVGDAAVLVSTLPRALANRDASADYERAQRDDDGGVEVGGAAVGDAGPEQQPPRHNHRPGAAAGRRKRGGGRRAAGFDASAEDDDDAEDANWTSGAHYSRAGDGDGRRAAGQRRRRAAADVGGGRMDSGRPKRPRRRSGNAYADDDDEEDDEEEYEDGEDLLEGSAARAGASGPHYQRSAVGRSAPRSLRLPIGEDELFDDDELVAQEEDEDDGRHLMLQRPARRLAGTGHSRMRADRKYVGGGVEVEGGGSREGTGDGSDAPLSAGLVSGSAILRAGLLGSPTAAVGGALTGGAFLQSSGGSGTTPAGTHSYRAHRRGARFRGAPALNGGASSVRDASLGTSDHRRFGYSHRSSGRSGAGAASPSDGGGADSDGADDDGKDGRLPRRRGSHDGSGNSDEDEGDEDGGPTPSEEARRPPRTTSAASTSAAAARPSRIGHNGGAVSAHDDEMLAGTVLLDLLSGTTPEPSPVAAAAAAHGGQQQKARVRHAPAAAGVAAGTQTSADSAASAAALSSAVTAALTALTSFGAQELVRRIQAAGGLPAMAAAAAAAGGVGTGSYPLMLPPPPVAPPDTQTAPTPTAMMAAVSSSAGSSRSSTSAPAEVEDTLAQIRAMLYASYGSGIGSDASSAAAAAAAGRKRNRVAAEFDIDDAVPHSNGPSPLPNADSVAAAGTAPSASKGGAEAQAAGGSSAADPSQSPPSSYVMLPVAALPAIAHLVLAMSSRTNAARTAGSATTSASRGDGQTDSRGSSRDSSTLSPSAVDRDDEQRSDAPEAGDGQRKPAAHVRRPTASSGGDGVGSSSATELAAGQSAQYQLQQAQLEAAAVQAAAAQVAAQTRQLQLQLASLRQQQAVQAAWQQQLNAQLRWQQAAHSQHVAAQMGAPGAGGGPSQGGVGQRPNGGHLRPPPLVVPPPPMGIVPLPGASAVPMTPSMLLLSPFPGHVMHGGGGGAAVHAAGGPHFNSGLGGGGSHQMLSPSLGGMHGTFKSSNSTYDDDASYSGAGAGEGLTPALLASALRSADSPAGGSAVAAAFGSAGVSSTAGGRHVISMGAYVSPQAGTDGKAHAAVNSGWPAFNGAIGGTPHGRPSLPVPLPTLKVPSIVGPGAHLSQTQPAVALAQVPQRTAVSVAAGDPDDKVWAAMESTAGPSPSAWLTQGATRNSSASTSAGPAASPSNSETAALEAGGHALPLQAATGATVAVVTAGNACTDGAVVNVNAPPATGTVAALTADVVDAVSTAAAPARLVVTETAARPPPLYALPPSLTRTTSGSVVAQQ